MCGWILMYKVHHRVHWPRLKWKPNQQKKNELLLDPPRPLSTTEKSIQFICPVPSLRQFTCPHIPFNFEYAAAHIEDRSIVDSENARYKLIMEIYTILRKQENSFFTSFPSHNTVFFYSKPMIIESIWTQLSKNLQIRTISCGVFGRTCGLMSNCFCATWDTRQYIFNLRAFRHQWKIKLTEPKLGAINFDVAHMPSCAIVYFSRST